MRLTSKIVPITQFPLVGIGLQEDLTVVDEEHAIAWDVLTHDGVSLQENLVLQFGEDSVNEVFISGLKYWHISEQSVAHHRQDLLKNKTNINYVTTERTHLQQFAFQIDLISTSGSTSAPL